MGCVLRWVPPATRGPAPLPQADEQLSQLQHERADLLRRVDEDQEDLNELMAKHKALIAQVGAAGGGGGLCSIPLPGRENPAAWLKANASPCGCPGWGLQEPDAGVRGRGGSRPHLLSPPF